LTGNEPALAAFETLRPRLFGVAYRMTGSVADAEDLCQDAWLRWRAVDPSTVESTEGYLVRLITNGALDRLQSAQARRESYVGPYLPEPLVTRAENAPLESAELADSLTFAFLVMLDALRPIERVVMLLHDVFGYSFDEVAATVDRSPTACRQIASRSRRRVSEQQVDVRRPGGNEERALVERFIATTLSGDIDALMAMLSPDVVQLDDGGAARRAARNPIVGPARVARLMVNLAKRIDAETVSELVRVNGTLGVLLTRKGEPFLVVTAELAPDGLVRRIYTQLNPDKLRHLRSWANPGGRQPSRAV
jgi:RNA polymerase sigma-70 factor, ECF subfamily